MVTRAEGLSLYYFEGCPSCTRVHEVAARLGLDLELRDITRNAAHRDELVAATGRSTVPCLRIDGAPKNVRWLHESTAIISLLEARFGA